VPPGFRMGGGDIDHRWNWPGGLTLERDGRILGPKDSFYYNEGAEWFALGLPRLPPPPDYLAHLAEVRARRGLPPPVAREAGVESVRVKVPPSFAERMRRESPVYSLREHFRLFRVAVVAERPARVGETFNVGADQTRVAKAESYATDIPSPSGVPTKGRRFLVDLVEHAPIFWSAHSFNGVGTLLFTRWFDDAYFLVNRARGNASRGGWYVMGAARIGTVGIMWRGLNFSPPSDWHDGKWVEQMDWFEGVTLAKVVGREEERFTKELRVERFEVRPAAAEGER